MERPRCPMRNSTSWRKSFCGMEAGSPDWVLMSNASWKLNSPTTRGSKSCLTMNSTNWGADWDRKVPGWRPKAPAAPYGHKRCTVMLGRITRKWLYSTYQRRSWYYWWLTLLTPRLASKLPACLSTPNPGASSSFGLVSFPLPSWQLPSLQISLSETILFWRVDARIAVKPTSRTLEIFWWSREVEIRMSSNAPIVRGCWNITTSPD